MRFVGTEYSHFNFHFFHRVLCSKELFQKNSYLQLLQILTKNSWLLFTTVSSMFVGIFPRIVAVPRRTANSPFRNLHLCVANAATITRAFLLKRSCLAVMCSQRPFGKKFYGRCYWCLRFARPLTTSRPTRTLLRTMLRTTAFSLRRYDALRKQKAVSRHVTGPARARILVTLTMPGEPDTT